MGLFTKKPKSYAILDRSLVCQICGHDEFDRREVLLNTTLASLLNLDWTNQSALCFVCEKCGYVHWFVRK